MIRFRRVTLGSLNAWLSRQPLPTAPPRYELRVWREVGTQFAPLRDELIARDGAYGEALARGKAVRLSLDQTMVADESAPLADGAEVAFFPPVTGG